MLKAIPAVSGLALLFLATTAQASETPDSPTPEVKTEAEKELHDDLLVTAGVGGFSDTDKAGGALSLTALRQKGWLGYGATFEYGGAILDYTTATAAPMVGVFVDGPSALRLGIAAVGGLHTYSGVGSGFISSTDPGASGQTIFVGTRAFAGVELGGKARFHIGLQLSLDDDLSRTQKTYRFTESAFTTPREATATHTVGALRAGAMLALGTAFDL